ncbi:MAG: hypothetical protein KQ78_01897 [Candidatus Izimaplasma bacterium HR2]|nr:MAG: hypothetical protein KQ78_01897 [Candidatus Izimaplasma bacterium HR2]
MELKKLHADNKIREIDFISLHKIDSFYYTNELSDCEDMHDRLMNTIATSDYVFIDIVNADTTTAIIVASIDRINITREDDDKIEIIAYAEDERIYDNELYGLIYTPVAFDQFLIGLIQKNGKIFRTHFLAVERIKKISKEIRNKRRREKEAKEKAEKKTERETKKEKITLELLK